MISAQIETALDEGAKLVDKAAAAGDRWLFIAVLVVLFTGVFFLFRYFVAQTEMDRKIRHELVNAIHGLQLAVDLLVHQLPPRKPK